MKLSRTGWNNVIIFSVMIFILLINITNKKLFSDDEKPENSTQFILPEHSVILSLSMQISHDEQVLFERLGRRWQMTTKGLVLDLTQQQIQQLIRTWQQSNGLVQASSMVVEGMHGTQVTILLADIENEQRFTLYALNDQVLVYNQQSQLWLALPATMAQQFLPFKD